MKSRKAARTPRKKSRAPKRGEGLAERAPVGAAQDQPQPVAVGDASRESVEAPPANDAAATAITPLDYMLRVMRDPAVEPERRDEMAKLALPYMHPKVSTSEASDKQAPPAESGELSEIDLARRIAFTMEFAKQNDRG